MRAASLGSSSSKKTHAEIGAANAAAGIDARAQEKSEMPRLRRAAEAGHIHQRGRARDARGAGAQ